LLTAGAIAAGVVHLFHPGGLPPLLAKLADQIPRTKRLAPPATVPEPTTHSPDGEEELHAAEKAYDAGDFAEATDLFIAAHAHTTSALRDRALRGLDKAVLAWALTRGAKATASPEPDVDAQLAEQVKAAELQPGEKAWYDALVFAAESGLRPRTKYLAQQAIGCATRGGPVEIRLRAVLPKAGSRAEALQAAMLRHGFLDRIDPRAAEIAALAKQAADEAKGVPVGKFSTEMRAKLLRAVELEKTAEEEYALSGPDVSNRAVHRKAALVALREARDIYQAAEEEDPKSRQVGERLRNVMEMLSHINKERMVGD
jgi:hypothetical protein